MIDIVLITLLLGIGMYWSDSMKKREVAYDAVKFHCRKMNVQLLDDYVALNALWLKRDERGWVRPWRSYMFEFTSTGNDRYNGKIVLLGQRVLSVQLQPHRFNEQHDSME